MAEQPSAVSMYFGTRFHVSQAKRRVERPVSHATTTMIAGGWTPSVETFSRTEEDEDPLKQQIKNIKGFLEQVSDL